MIVLFTGDHLRHKYLVDSFSKVFDDLIGMNVDFVQDNHSRSSKGVLRGLHYQIRQPQGKLVRVTAGKVYDVAVDMRRDSSTFGQWAGTILTAEGQEQFWVPEGFAHGFLVLSDTADFLYKTTNYYAPEHDRSVLWNDKTIGIEWPISDSLQPTLSDKDRNAVEFNQADYF